MKDTKVGYNAALLGLGSGGVELGTCPVRPGSGRDGLGFDSIGPGSGRVGLNGLSPSRFPSCYAESEIPAWALP